MIQPEDIDTTVFDDLRQQVGWEVEGSANRLTNEISNVATDMREVNANTRSIIGGGIALVILLQTLPAAWRRLRPSSNFHTS